MLANSYGEEEMAEYDLIESFVCKNLLDGLKAYALRQTHDVLPYWTLNLSPLRVIIDSAIGFLLLVAFCLHQCVVDKNYKHHDAKKEKQHLCN